MSGLRYEREYAREMLFAAIRCQSDTNQPPGTGRDCVEDITALTQQALDAGCCRTKLIVELANLGARLSALSSSTGPLTLARAIADEEREPSR